MQTSSKRDLEWFFDDWVYRDRGLPDFHVASAYVRPLLSEANKSFLVTATIENRGHAGAEVPVLVQTPSGEKSVRVLVKAGEKESGRIEVPVAPDKITVNDGSVPEANIGNNVYDVPPPAQKQLSSGDCVQVRGAMNKSKKPHLRTGRGIQPSVVDNT